MRNVHPFVFVLLAGQVAVLGGCGPASTPSAGVPDGMARVTLGPAVVSEPVGQDPDDPAIWHHPEDPARSLILGTDKVAAPDGALVVFDLAGRQRQRIGGIDGPNNVDVEQGVTLRGRTVDIAVVTERWQHRLRVFEIQRTTGALAEIGRIPVLAGEAGEAREPMGVALYRRPADGAAFAIVAPKAGDRSGYLAQYRLTAGPDGALTGTLVRRFGNFSASPARAGDSGEIEAVVVDDEAGYVYYADEGYGIRKWHADPDHREAGQELVVFGTEGYLGEREGLAVYPTGPGRGYLLSADQVDGGSMLRVYPREGTPGAPHEHPLVATIRTVSDATDGIEATALPLPGFDAGAIVMMNSRGRNFLVYDAASLPR